MMSKDRLSRCVKAHPEICLGAAFVAFDGDKSVHDAARRVQVVVVGGTVAAAGREIQVGYRTTRSTCRRVYRALP